MDILIQFVGMLVEVLSEQTVPSEWVLGYSNLHFVGSFELFSKWEMWHISDQSS